ncbi:MAG TPA: hypothetical protein VHE34_21160 [Puia sp.]|uniref:hypothetical protein n=1 Tax=Puia sp. TaxID=2045100 RepID=UPI002C8CF8DC|nr:hypothetical protein [Puia sp.]HVU97753.1 hypothetical protein [Puia sp.]
MLYNLSLVEILLIAAGAVALYLAILATVFGKKLPALLGRSLRASVSQATATVSHGMPERAVEELPPLIDKPADHPAEQAGMFHPYDDLYSEPIDEGAITLLKSAEHVVEQIQEVVDHIASHPANPDEVCSKIRSIVSHYSFFEDTEYYDAINSFIVVTVQRDCDLALTEDDLKLLWVEEAA